jgi:hypothetical protein
MSCLVFLYNCLTDTHKSALSYTRPESYINKLLSLEPFYTSWNLKLKFLPALSESITPWHIYFIMYSVPHSVLLGKNRVFVSTWLAKTWDYAAVRGCWKPTHRTQQRRNRRQEKSDWVRCFQVLSDRSMLIYWLTYSATLHMEEKCFSEASVDFQRPTWHCIPEDRTLHNHNFENLKSYFFQKKICSTIYEGESPNRSQTEVKQL